MKSQKRGLNRGLNALLAGTGLLNKTTISADLATITEKNSEDNSNAINNYQAQQAHRGSNDLNINKLKINQLTPGQFQPRSFMHPEELSELVESIKTQGILQPLIVRKLLNNQYEIIAGERRWQAANIAGLTEVPVIIKNVNNQDALTIALIENIQRSNLNALEEAIALDRLSKEFALTHNEIATAVGKSRTAITNLLRILQLPAEIKQMLEQNKLDLGHAKVLLGADYNLQLKIAHKIQENSLSVRATEQLLKELQTKLNTTASQDLSLIELGKQKNLKNTLDPDTYKLQQKLRELLGAKVIIETKTNNKHKKGKLIIPYNNLEELEGILEHFNLS